MHVIMVMVWLLSSLLFALDGEVIFAQKCASCHRYYIPQTKIIANAQHNNRELNLTAPTLTEISFALKDQVGDRTLDPEGQKFQIEEWLTDYLDAPSKEKGVLPDAFNRFFMPMPRMKGELDEEEIEALTDFIYGYAERMIVEHSVKRHTYESALKRAQKENKIVLIEGYIPFCRGCIKMDREVFVDPRVKEALDKNFVVVKRNLLIEKLPLTIKRLGTPSFYFIDKTGTKVLEMVQGTGTVEEFLALLASVKK